MNPRKAMLVWVLILAAAATLALPMGAYAAHGCGCWKYANYTINCYNVATGN